MKNGQRVRVLRAVRDIEYTTPIALTSEATIVSIVGDAAQVRLDDGDELYVHRCQLSPANSKPVSFWVNVYPNHMPYYVYAEKGPADEAAEKWALMSKNLRQANGPDQEIPTPERLACVLVHGYVEQDGPAS